VEDEKDKRQTEETDRREKRKRVREKRKGTERRGLPGCHVEAY